VNVQRQPGANTISVVKASSSCCPQLEANLPVAIKVTILTDLTTSIECLGRAMSSSSSSSPSRWW
jgi:multidrug efflux pump